MSNLNETRTRLPDLQNVLLASNAITVQCLSQRIPDSYVEVNCVVAHGTQSQALDFRNLEWRITEICSLVPCHALIVDLSDVKCDSMEGLRIELINQSVLTGFVRFVGVENGISLDLSEARADQFVTSRVVAF